MLAKRIKAIIIIKGKNIRILFPINIITNTVITAKRAKSAMESNLAPNSLSVFVLRAIYPSITSLNPQIRYKTKNSNALWKVKSKAITRTILLIEIIFGICFNICPFFLMKICSKLIPYDIKNTDLLHR